MTEHEKFGLGMAALAALILYLLNRNGLLHESVTSTIIGGLPVTSAGTIQPDPVTGAPMFDQNVGTSIPANEAFAVPPIDWDGKVTFNPTQPKRATCPTGYTLWKNATDGSYECIAT
jgi:hypothetical protein